MPSRRFLLPLLLSLAFPTFSVAQSAASWRAGVLQLMPARRNEIIPGQVMIKYTPEKAASIAAAATAGRLPKSQVSETFVSRVADTGWTLWQVPESTDILALVAELRQRPDVVYAEPVNRVYALTLPDPNDPDYYYNETDPNLILDFNDENASFRRLWNLDDIDAFAGWSVYPGYWLTSTVKPSRRPKIAVIDTGCDMNHPDFINAGGTGTDISQGGQFLKTAGAYFHLGTAVKGASLEDKNGHGTHVTGIALASGNNGPFSSSVDNGVIGMGYNGSGIIYRVFDDQGNASDTDSAAAIIAAANKGADIINLSLGTENYSQVFQDAVTYAFQKGCAVFAAGNEDGNGGGDLGPIYPAACSGACAVTAAGPDHTYADAYAGTGDYIDVAAPGGNIKFAPDFSSYSIQFVWSTAMRTDGELKRMSDQGAVYPPYDHNYAYLAGTSMACPHVAGAAALYYGKNNLGQGVTWSNVKVYRALEKSANGLGAPDGTWETHFGYGELDLYNLLTDANPRAATVGSIMGMVYYNGTPIANVAVKAKIGSVTFNTTTRKDGTYRFDELPPGKAIMTTAPLGAVKTKDQWVVIGSDTPGVDFWCGTYTGDSTPPVAKKFAFQGGHKSTGGSVAYLGYDTETGIDLVSLKIGTTAGGQNVLAPTEMNPYTPTSTFKATMVTGTTYYFTMTWTNGAGLTTSSSFSVVW